MHRYKLQVEYMGTGFLGWQVQSGIYRLKTIQGCIEEALGHIQKGIQIHGSGRTDRGVHAAMQVAHVDFEREQDVKSLQRAANYYLPTSIRVRGVWSVDTSFHARFSAERRAYRFFLYDGPIVPPFLFQRVVKLKGTLCLDRFEAILKTLQGWHDFGPLSLKSPPEKTTFRMLHQASIIQNGPLVIVNLVASGFLRRMVRLIVGASISVAQHHACPIDWLQNWLKTRTMDDNPHNYHARHPFIKALGPDGLYLWDVQYPKPWSGDCIPLLGDHFFGPYTAI